jgi:hypothetical protein
MAKEGQICIACSPNSADGRPSAHGVVKERTVLLTSIFALATTLLSHRPQTENAERALRQEQLRRLRQERREAYVQYWSTWITRCG